MIAGVLPTVADGAEARYAEMIRLRAVEHLKRRGLDPDTFDAIYALLRVGHV